MTQRTPETPNLVPCILSLGLGRPCPKGLNGRFPKLGVPYCSPIFKDYSILGSILGSPYIGKLPNIQTRISLLAPSVYGLGFMHFCPKVSRHEPIWDQTPFRYLDP